jgi:hypothetical protein
MSQQNNDANTRMEFNGVPLYIKSDNETGIPYLYDIDTNEHVGYWCQKKGEYVMFSPYEQILNNLKRSVKEEMRRSGNNFEAEPEAESESEVEPESESEAGAEPESESEAGAEPESEEEPQEEAEYPTSTVIKFFILMLIYIMFQKHFQMIYVDFIFAFAFTILYNKMVTTIGLNL